MKTRLLAIGIVGLFFFLIYLYVREFPVFSNTLNIQALWLYAALTGCVILVLVYFIFNHRIRFIKQQRPEWVALIVCSFLFSPLWVSLLNRSIGETKYESFEFIREEAYFASGYGFIKGEPMKPTGYRLQVKYGDKTYQFKYKSQAYYPLSKRGDSILLPIKHGLLGIQIMKLK
ncbi:MAG: hypothetical protein R2792_12710 [Saprospiraceae bacterium]